MKKCVICGKEFEPYYGTPGQVTCCGECRVIYNKNIGRKYDHDNRAWILEKSRDEKRRKNNGKVICKICGRPVYRDWNSVTDHGHMHDECIYDDVIDTLRSGDKITMLQRQRLYSRGYTVEEFIAEFGEELNEKQNE